MLTLLFILFIVFIVWPLVKVVLRVNQFKRQARDMFRQASSQATGQQQAQRKGGWTKATPRKKKIGGDVGEYVAFEEVASTSTQYTQSRTDGQADSFRPDSQVSDAEWEDIK